MQLNNKQRRQILGNVRKRVLSNHFNAGAIDYASWSQRFDSKSVELLDAELPQFEAGITELLQELRSSHTGFFNKRPSRLLSQHTINATLSAFDENGDNRWYFLDVFEDGPADKAGIKPGDALHKVDGIAYSSPDQPPFRTGCMHLLSVSGANGESQRDLSLVIPRTKGTKDVPPILPPKSIVHSMIAPGVGMLKISWFPGAMGLAFAKSLDKSITDLKAKGCNRLIIDLRGNIGGGLGFARLASYLCPDQRPIGYSLTPKRLRRGFKVAELERVLYPASKLGFATTLARFAFRDKSIFLLTQGLGVQPFHGRTVILVNEWTNSAAEMLASFASENKLATIVGIKSAGHVLGAVNFDASSGYFVRLPVFGWYATTGTCVEGNGVQPDITVGSDPYRLNGGFDEQLIAGQAFLNSLS
jgi:C-terminal processing protease CtpA/Prc